MLEAGDLGDPWAADQLWRWAEQYLPQLAATEGPEVARAYVLNALAADLAGVLTLAVQAAELEPAPSRALAWREVGGVATRTRDGMIGASTALPDIERCVRRGATLLDRVAALADTAPRAAADRGPPPLLPAAPSAASAAGMSLRSWFVRTGAQPAIDVLTVAGVVLPMLAPDCAAWAADLAACWRALE